MLILARPGQVTLPIHVGDNANGGYAKACGSIPHVGSRFAVWYACGKSFCTRLRRFAHQIIMMYACTVIHATNNTRLAHNAAHDGHEQRCRTRSSLHNATRALCSHLPLASRSAQLCPVQLLRAAARARASRARARQGAGHAQLRPCAQRQPVPVTPSLLLQPLTPTATTAALLHTRRRRPCALETAPRRRHACSTARCALKRAQGALQPRPAPPPLMGFSPQLAPPAAAPARGFKPRERRSTSVRPCCAYCACVCVRDTAAQPGRTQAPRPRRRAAPAGARNVL